MELRQVALEVARILQDAGKHALNDQMNPRDLKSFEMTDNHLSFTSDIDKRLAQFISNRITYVDVFDGFWQFRPEECHPGNGIGALAASTARSISCAACRNGPSPSHCSSSTTNAPRSRSFRWCMLRRLA